MPRGREEWKTESNDKVGSDLDGHADLVLDVERKGLS